jgi:hypothetical protein
MHAVRGESNRGRHVSADHWQAGPRADHRVRVRGGLTPACHAPCPHWPPAAAEGHPLARRAGFAGPATRQPSVAQLPATLTTRARARARAGEGTRPGRVAPRRWSGVEAVARLARPALARPRSAAGSPPRPLGSTLFVPVQCPNHLGFAGSLWFSTPERRFSQDRLEHAMGRAQQP